MWWGWVGCGLVWCGKVEVEFEYDDEDSGSEV